MAEEQKAEVMIRVSEDVKKELSTFGNASDTMNDVVKKLMRNERWLTEFVNKIGKQKAWLQYFADKINEVEGRPKVDAFASKRSKP